MGFFPVKQEVDGFANTIVVNLPIEMLVNDLCSLLGGNIREDICRQISRAFNVSSGPGITRSIGQLRR
jgi:hypothetical protein